MLQTKKDELHAFLDMIIVMTTIIDSLNNLLSSFKNQPDIVAISETKLQKEKINRN